MRFPDWPARLMAFVEERRRDPFRWGENDCCLFACDCVVALTGEDPAADLRGRYSTAIGAARALKKFAGGGIPEAARKIAQRMGRQEIPVTLAQRGDVALVMAKEGPALGIVAGARVVVMGPSGLGSLPLSAASTAWRV